MPYRVSAVRAAVATHAPPLSVARRRPHNEALVQAQLLSARLCWQRLAALYGPHAPLQPRAAGSERGDGRWGRPSATASRVSDVAASDRDAAILVQLLPPLGNSEANTAKRDRGGRERPPGCPRPCFSCARMIEASPSWIRPSLLCGPRCRRAPATGPGLGPCHTRPHPGRAPDAASGAPTERPRSSQYSNQQSHAQHYHSTRIIRPKRPTKTSEAGHE